MYNLRICGEILDVPGKDLAVSHKGVDIVHGIDRGNHETDLFDGACNIARGNNITYLEGQIATASVLMYCIVLLSLTPPIYNADRFIIPPIPPFLR
jgi:hypothetical protein